MDETNQNLLARVKNTTEENESLRQSLKDAADQIKMQQELIATKQQMMDVLME